VARPGRKPFEEELRLRERIEGLYLSGLRPVQIRGALASAQNQVPIELSLSRGGHLTDRHAPARRAGREPAPSG
jgi:hypothetical protein